MTLFLAGSTSQTTYTGNADQLYSGTFVASVSGTATEIRFYCQTSCNVKVAIYDAGSPTRTRLGVNNTGTACTGGQWNTVSISDTELTASVSYNLAIVSDTGSFIGLESATGGDAEYKSSNPYSSGCPSSYTSPTNSVFIFSIAAYGYVNHNYDAGTGTSITASTPSGSWTYGLIHQYDAGSGVSASVSIGSSTWTKIPRYLFGETQDANYHHNADRIFIRRFTASLSGVVTEVQVYSILSGNVKVMIYDDNGGAPGNLLSSNDSGASCTGGQWNSIPVSEFYASSGTNYWIGAITDTNQAIGRCGTVLGTTEYLDATYSTWTAPSTWPGGTSNTYESVYAAFGNENVERYDAGTGVSIAASIEESGWSKTKAYSGNGKSAQISVPSGDWTHGIGHIYDAGTGVSIAASIEESGWSKTKAYSGNGKSAQISVPSGDWNLTIAVGAGVGISEQMSTDGPGYWNIGTLHNFDAGYGVSETIQLSTGVWTSAALTPFRGTLKRAMLFNRALTSHEVKALYNRAIIESE